MPDQVSDFVEIVFSRIYLIRWGLWKNSIRDNKDKQIETILKVSNQKQKYNS